MAKRHSHTCKRCGNEWLGFLPNPKKCPKCGKRDWNIENNDGVD